MEPTAFVIALQKRPYDAYDVFTNVGVFRKVDGVIVRVHLGPDVPVLLNRDPYDDCYNCPINAEIAHDFLTQKMPRRKNATTA
jgi:hypothetical protein